MADVAKNAHSSSTHEDNGSVVTGVDKVGNKHVIPPSGNNIVIQPANLEGKLTNRFDDPTYYSA